MSLHSAQQYVNKRYYIMIYALSRNDAFKLMKEVTCSDEIYDFIVMPGLFNAIY